MLCFSRVLGFMGSLMKEKGGKVKVCTLKNNTKTFLMPSKVADK
jgi:hypothetical protein